MTHSLRIALPRIGAGAAIAVAFLLLYAVLLDQGAILTPFVGAMSRASMFLHEFTHDARHMLGAPCH